MSDIYLAIDGKQVGPYEPTLLRQYLTDGQVAAETPAWHEGLSEWSTVAEVLKKFPATATVAVPPPYIPPPPTPKPSPAPSKSEMTGCTWIATIVGVIMFLGVVALGFSVQPMIRKAQESAATQQARAIAIMMSEYAGDHNGAYPDGKTSTEVFQQLLDGKYATDPAIFYIVLMPGKIAATSNTLTAANVCFDVTGGVTSDSPEGLPLVYSTGYSVTYASGGLATVDAVMPAFFPGMALACKNNSASFKKADALGNVPGIIPDGFDPGTHVYRQLKP